MNMKNWIAELLDNGVLIQINGILVGKGEDGITRHYGVINMPEECNKVLQEMFDAPMGSPLAMQFPM